MRIALVHRGTHNPERQDVRIRKFVTCLTAAGHEVTVISRTVRLLYPSVLPNPAWFLHVLSAIRGRHYDLLIARDLPLALPVWFAGWVLGVPIVLDMAENWPAAMRVWDTPGWLKAADAPDLAAQVERAIVPCFDHVLVVCEEQQERLVGELGVRPKRISLVRNTSPAGTHRVNPQERQGAGIEPPKGDLCAAVSLVYVGTIDAHRGLGTCIRALPMILRVCPELQLHVIGSHSKVSLRLQEIAAAVGVSESVTFNGPLMWSDVSGRLGSRRVIGIVPQPSNPHTDTTIPNKLFDYMSAGLPVVASDAKPLKRVVEQEQCGLVFRSGDAADFARCVIRLVQDEALAGALGRNGRAAVDREYNWADDSARLLTALAQAADPTAGRKQRNSSALSASGEVRPTTDMDNGPVCT
jgi:glycosyltransferase involved in cell wall biosynthesis